MTPPLQFLTITHKYVNVSTINQSKSRPVFRVVSSLDDINAQCLPENELVRDLQSIFPLMGGGNPEDNEPCSPSPVIFTVFWGILNNPAKLQSAVGNGLKTAINRGSLWSTAPQAKDDDAFKRLSREFATPGDG